MDCPYSALLTWQCWSSMGSIIQRVKQNSAHVKYKNTMIKTGSTKQYKTLPVSVQVWQNKYDIGKGNTMQII